MSQPQRLPPNPLLIRLNAAIDKHVDTEDRADFLDTVMVIALQYDADKGRAAGDRYLEDVIRSLTGGIPKDDIP